MPRVDFYTGRVGKIDVITTSWRKPRPLPQRVVREKLEEAAKSGSRVVMLLRDNTLGNICIPAWVIAAKLRTVEKEPTKKTEPLELKYNRACGYYGLVGRFLIAESLVSKKGPGRFKEPSPYTTTTPGSPCNNIRPHLTLGENGTCSVLSMGIFPPETFDEYLKDFAGPDHSNFALTVNS